MREVEVKSSKKIELILVIIQLFNKYFIYRIFPSYLSTFISFLNEGQVIICGKPCLPAFSNGKQCDGHMFSWRRGWGWMSP